jgi:hypothetical protein
VLFSVFYLILRGLLRLLPSTGDDRDREIEILVLRHQVKILSRKAGRPKTPARGPSLLGRWIQDAPA